ncbi:MAG: chemotaxis protein CheA [Novosphingobium sp.]|nr:chemotaxis protein CheA [Novosphingobium sp.]
MTPEEIQQIFFVECEESLAAAEAGLAACKSGTQDADTVNAIFRAVHSIKGGAGAFGFTAMQAYTHTFETLLSDVRDGTVPLGDALVSMLLRALDTLSDHVNSARNGGDAPDDAALLAELTAAQAASGGSHPTAEAPPEADSGADAPAAKPAGDDDFGLDFESMFNDLGPAPTAVEPEPEPAVEAEPARWLVHIRPHAGAMTNGSEPLLMLRELASLGGECVACDLDDLPPLERLCLGDGYLGWTFAMPANVSEAMVRDVFDFVSEECGIAIGPDAEIPPVQFSQPSKVVAAASDPDTRAPAVQDPGPPQTATQANVSALPTVAAAAAPAAASPPAATSAQAAAAAAGQSIRIDLGKLDRLIDSVGELVIAQAMLAQRLSGEVASAGEEMAMLDALTREIQESAMAIRAQPISSVFSRVPRILRELSASTGKQVRLELFGETTELDKTVIERLGEPLTHLIRNAVDHGIETVEERIAAGKPAEGTLTLLAEHRSGRIHIVIADDGKGIDRDRVLAKAVEKGLIAPDAQLSAEEIDNLIFAPGFSTAASVTSVSGRGVGMDVVRQNVKELGGRIITDSQAGKGTRFTLTLPLTLAISDGMIVTVGDQTLVVPLTHVVESLRPKPGDINGLGSQRQMLNVRGKFIPVVPVCQAMGATQCLESANEGVLIVVDTEAAGQAALLVDDICDQRQFVIKSLDTHYRAVRGVAGATILGNGRVALILDVDGLVAGALAAPDRQQAA